MKLFIPLKSSLQEFKFRSDRSKNSLKTAVACIIAYAITLFTPLPQSQWVVITILVVMSAQITMGSLLIKSYLRLLGTAIGALFSIVILLTVHNDPWSLATALFVSVLFFSYVAGSPKDISVAGTLGAVTIAVIMLGQNPGLQQAGLRFVEIISGLIIALVISRLVLPVRAKNQLQKSISDTLTNLKNHYAYSFQPPKEVLDERVVAIVDDGILSALPKQRKLINEVSIEPGTHRLNKSLYQRILDCERKIYRSINLMQYCHSASPHNRQLINQLDGLKEFNREIIKILNKLAGFVGAKATQIDTKTNAKQLDELLRNIEVSFNDSVIPQNYEYMACVTSFLFSARYLLEESMKLGRLLNKLLKQNLEKTA